MCQNSEKPNDPNSRKHPDRCQEAEMDRRILPATTIGSTSKTAVNWHIKVEDIEYNVGLTLQHHSQHAKNQVNS